MTPFTHDSAARAGSRGGSKRSDAQRARLKALHESRRGVRVNRPGVSVRELHTLLGDISTAVREPVPGVRSMRVVANYCRVSDRTVRRWLDGSDVPPSTMVRRLKGWLRRHDNG